jgi:hypothetical protein
MPKKEKKFLKVFKKFLNEIKEIFFLFENKKEIFSDKKFPSNLF